MFEVTKYEFPHIFVTSRRTGETFKFLVGIEGALAHNKARLDQKDAWQVAMAYLTRRAQLNRTQSHPLGAENWVPAS
jgi:hypothetical protein